jgi:uncharacterized glyoxalase superfamily protein PhnB
MNDGVNSRAKLRGITPMIEVRDLRESIDFYTSKLGFVCNGVWPEDGNPSWASLTNGSADLMFAIRNQHSTVAEPTFTGTFYLYPGDVDAAWEELKDAVEVEYPIEDFIYGMREFGIRDCNGYLLQYGQGLDEIRKREAAKE